MTELQGFHHVAITVRDRDASIAWYSEVLGFEELFREEAPDRRACVMRFAAGGFGVGLVEYPRVEFSPFDPQRCGLDHVAFTVGTLDELNGWALRLDDHAVSHSGVIEIPPGAILNLKDPDGVALALFWDRP